MKYCTEILVIDNTAQAYYICIEKHFQIAFYLNNLHFRTDANLYKNYYD